MAADPTIPAESRRPRGKERSERVLIVDDEPAIRSPIRRFLATRGYAATEAGDCRSALERFSLDSPDVVITDYDLPDGTGLDLLARFRTLDPDVPVVVLTGHGTIELAVRAIKEGAEHFLTKPLDLEALAVVLERLLERQRLARRHNAGETHRARASIHPFRGTSAAIQELATQARKIAASSSTVLILGETGSGKGVLARWLHENSPRAGEPMVDLNCASLAGELLESELFGYVKGAFTGAVGEKTGLVEVANRGTLFLDEIGDMDLKVQPRLLKVLEEQRLRRLGDVRDRLVDVRLIAATHRDLTVLVRDNAFRSDLYYRINTVPLTVPPLRERREDIPVLAAGLLQQLAAEVARPALSLSPAALASLQGYAWPGNVRELRNVLERAALLSQNDVLQAADLLFAPTPGSPPDGGSGSLEDVEREHIRRVLKEEGGRVRDAAARLGVPRSSLYQKLKKYGLDSSGS